MAVEPFENWARTVRSQPSAWARPGTELEVIELVRSVAARGGRLRASGARHSWSPIAASDDVQVDLGGLDRMATFDPDEGTVTVGAGIRLKDLVHTLARAGLALPVLGSVLEQHLAGALATGTHGSSLHVGNLASLVERLVLVDGRGELRELGPHDPELAGARVHLGALGLVTQITLRVVPHYRLVERRVRMPLEQAAHALVPAARDHAFAKLWWLPGCRDALLHTYDPTDDPRDPSALAAAIDRAANAAVFPVLLGAGKLWPALIPWTNRLVDAVHFRPSERTGPYDTMLAVGMPPRHQESERAFPLAHTGDALVALADHLARHRQKLDFILEARVVKGDDAWMSPAYGGDVCQLGVYGTHSPDLVPATTAFDAIVAPWGGRPHWGKATDIAWDEVRRLWPRAEDFRALARAFDPRGLFRNRFLDRVLGPVG